MTYDEVVDKLATKITAHATTTELKEVFHQDQVKTIEDMTDQELIEVYRLWFSEMLDIETLL